MKRSGYSTYKNDRSGFRNSSKIDRYTTVKTGQEHSDQLKMDKGTQQGSLLSPYIYLMYGNDLGEYLKKQYRLFADDTILIMSHIDPEMARINMEEEFQRLQTLAHSNKITINKDKTEFLHDKPKRHTTEIKENVTFHDHQSPTTTTTHTKKEQNRSHYFSDNYSKEKIFQVKITLLRIRISHLPTATIQYFRLCLTYE